MEKMEYSTFFSSFCQALPFVWSPGLCNCQTLSFYIFESTAQWTGVCLCVFGDPKGQAVSLLRCLQPSTVTGDKHLCAKLDKSGGLWHSERNISFQILIKNNPVCSFHRVWMRCLKLMVTRSSQPPPPHVSAAAALTTTRPAHPTSPPLAHRRTTRPAHLMTKPLGQPAVAPPAGRWPSGPTTCLDLLPQLLSALRDPWMERGGAGGTTAAAGGVWTVGSRPVLGQGKVAWWSAHFGVRASSPGMMWMGCIILVSRGHVLEGGCNDFHN